MAEAGDIGTTQIVVNADTATADLNLRSTSNEFQKLGGAADAAGSQVAAAGEKVDRASKLQAQAAERARRAWQQEILAQERAAEASAATARAQELAALKADILARSVAGAGAAAGHTVPSWSAASGAIRVLEGGMTNNVRAAERFIATTLGLGPALQAAFPVVGAIAMAGVLSVLIERASKFAEDATVLSNELGIGWLQAAIGQVDGLAKSVKQADDEIMNLARDSDQLKSQNESARIELIRLTQGQGAAYRAQALDLTGGVDLKTGRSTEGYIPAQQKILANLQPQAAELKSRIDAAQAQAAQAATAVPHGVNLLGDYVGAKAGATAADLQKQKDVLDAQIKTVKEHIAGAQLELQKLNIQAAQADAKTAISAAGRAPGKTPLDLLREQMMRQMIAASKPALDALHDMEDSQRMPSAPPAFAGVAGLDNGRSERQQEEARNAQARAARADYESALAQIEAANRAKEVWITLEERAGMLSPENAARQLALVHSGTYSAMQEEFIRATTAGANIPGAEIARTTGQREMERFGDALRVDMLTPMGQFREAIEAVSDRVTNLGGVIAEQFTRDLGTFNESLVTVLSTPHSQLQGRNVFGEAGAQIFRSASGAVLQYGEGALLKGLLGRNPLAKVGTRENPMWTRSADLAGSAASGAGGALAAALGAAAGGAGASKSGGSGLFGSVVGALVHLLPGFAGGGEIRANMPAIVGERGPEIFMPSSSGSIVPNDRAFGPQVSLGGVHVDARGATDPTAVETAVNRAMERHAPSIVAASVAAMNDYHARRPGMRR